MLQKIAPSAVKAQELAALLPTPVTITTDGAPGLIKAVLLAVRRGIR